MRGFCWPAGRRTVALLLAIAATAVVLSWQVGFASHGRGERRAAPGRFTARGAQPVRRSFAIFRTRPEAVPASLRGAAGEVPGLRWKLAQELPAGMLPKTWAVPGDGFICIFHLGRLKSVAGMCGTDKQDRKEGLTLIVLRGHGRDEGGLNGSSSVSHHLERNKSSHGVEAASSACALPTECTGTVTQCEDRQTGSRWLDLVRSWVSLKVASHGERVRVSAHGRRALFVKFGKAQSEIQIAGARRNLVPDTLLSAREPFFD